MLSNFHSRIEMSGMFDSVVEDGLAGVVVDHVDIVVAELLPAADAADRQVVAGELSMRGEGGVAADASLVDWVGVVRGVGGGGVGDIEVTVPGLGRVFTPA